MNRKLISQSQVEIFVDFPGKSDVHLVRPMRENGVYNIIRQRRDDCAGEGLFLMDEFSIPTAQDQAMNLLEPFQPLYWCSYNEVSKQALEEAGIHGL